MFIQTRSKTKPGNNIVSEVTLASTVALTNDLDATFVEITITPPGIDDEQNLLEITQNLDGIDDAEEWLCHLCKENLSAQPDSIGCDGVCKLWFHVKCVDLDDDQFAILNEDDTSKWFCSTCRISPPPVSALVDRSTSP